MKEETIAGTLERDAALDPTLDQLSRRKLLGRVGAGVVGASALASAAGAQQDDKPKHGLDDPSINRQNITFPSKGVDGKTAEIKGLLATPKGGGKRGTVIVIHEIFGLTDHIKDVACRFALAGYNALAPDLFTREGEPPAISGGFQPLMAFVSAIPDSQILGDLKNALLYTKHNETSNGKVGCVGYCWGGRISMLLDADAPGLNAAVAYYGRISGTPNDKQTTYPIDVVEKMRAPLLGHFGAKDTGIPPAEANKLRDALKAHHKTGEIYVYEKAGHAFNNDTRESYEPESAKLATQRTLDWFGKYLK